jgi:hypothetical protein
MSFDNLGGPKDVVGRWVLRACARVKREPPNEAEFTGLLLCEPKVGSQLVLALDQRRRLRTSTILKIEPGPDGTIYVHTANSRYWVRRLSQLRQVSRAADPSDLQESLELA